MKQYLVMISCLWLLLYASTITATPVYTPVLSVADSQRDVEYLLEEKEISFFQKTYRQYRLWQNNSQTNQRALLSWLGTKLLPNAQHIVGMAWDAEQQRLLLADANARKIFAFYVSSKNQMLISSAKKGTGPAFEKMGGMVFDPLSRSIIIVDQATHNDLGSRILTQVAVDTGNRSRFYATTVEQATGPYSITYAPDSYQLFLSDSRKITGINLFTNESYILSDHSEQIGQGPLIVRSEHIAFDRANHRLLASDPLLRRIMAVDVATGERSIIIDYLLGDTQSLCWPGSISVNGTSAIIADTGYGDWFRLDLNLDVLEHHIAVTASHPICKPSGMAHDSTLISSVTNHLASYPVLVSNQTHPSDPSWFTILVDLALLVITAYNWLIKISLAFILFFSLPFLLLVSPILIPTGLLINILSNKTIFIQEYMQPIITFLYWFASWVGGIAIAMGTFIAIWFAPIIVLLTLIALLLFGVDPSLTNPS